MSLLLVRFISLARLGHFLIFWTEQIFVFNPRIFQVSFGTKMANKTPLKTKDRNMLPIQVPRFHQSSWFSRTQSLTQKWARGYWACRIPLKSPCPKVILREKAHFLRVSIISLLRCSLWVWYSGFLPVWKLS